MSYQNGNAHRVAPSYLFGGGIHTPVLPQPNVQCYFLSQWLRSIEIDGVLKEFSEFSKAPYLRVIS